MSFGSFNTMKYKIISIYTLGGNVYNAPASKDRAVYSQLPGLQVDSFHHTWGTSAFLSRYSHLLTVPHPESPPQGTSSQFLIAASHWHFIWLLLLCHLQVGL